MGTELVDGRRRTNFPGSPRFALEKGGFGRQVAGVAEVSAVRVGWRGALWCHSVRIGSLDPMSR